MGQALRRFRVSLANLLWFLYSFGMSRRWKRATRDVSGTQAAVLKRILFENADSEFGREHHFAGVSSVELYQRAVPLRLYEEFQPYIERIGDGQPQVLTAQRVLQFGLTSGSTQASKLIPYTKALVSEFQEGIDPWVYYLIRRFPRILLGKTYWSVTPIGERKSHTTGGIAIDRKSTRLNSSHANISYAAFCLKKIIWLALLVSLPRMKVRVVVDILMLHFL